MSLSEPAAASAPRNAIKTIAVFCGFSAGNRPEYMQAARSLGAEMAGRNIGLVYGGGSGGLMGEIARACQDGGQAVLGVIPEALAPREVSGHTIGEMRVVDSMHARKALMAEEADAFIALPGGFGTLEELVEVVTWQQLGLHAKPVGVLNVRGVAGAGFYDHLLAFVDHCVAEGFIRELFRGILVQAASPAELIDRLAAYRAPASLLQLKRDMAAQQPQLEV